MDKELEELSCSAVEISHIARRLGLDFYPVQFEICPAEALYTFGAYGMPVRFTHWSFGKAFYRLKTQYDLNLSRIYELVINSNPAYAFLLEGNRLIQNKLVMAHVYAHVDFFKNNRYFNRTPKDMVERMGAHAERVREHELRFGRDKVEQTLDALLAIQEHVDSRAHIAPTNRTQEVTSKQKRHQVRPYDDLFEFGVVWDDEQEQPVTKEHDDLLLFLIENAPGLAEWQRDLASIVRTESLYFYPQMETKIINEGWATFWHERILRELDLSVGESVDFAVMHSQVVQPARWQLNPYYLGFKMWESIGQRYGDEGLFEIREANNDISFVRNYLNQDLVEQLNLFNYRKVGAHWQVSDTNWEKVRDNLVQGLVNCGHPRILVVDGDYEGKGALYLRHAHEGVDLDVLYMEKTLALVQFLWGKSVFLETRLDDKQVLYECSNGTVTRRQPSGNTKKN